MLFHYFGHLKLSAEHRKKGKCWTYLGALSPVYLKKLEQIYPLFWIVKQQQPQPLRGVR